MHRGNVQKIRIRNHAVGRHTLQIARSILKLYVPWVQVLTAWPTGICVAV